MSGDLDGLVMFVDYSPVPSRIIRLPRSQREAVFPFCRSPHFPRKLRLEDPIPMSEYSFERVIIRPQLYKATLGDKVHLCARGWHQGSGTLVIGGTFNWWPADRV